MLVCIDGMDEEVKQWIVREGPTIDDVDGAGLPKILLKLLGQRGVKGREAIETFLKPKLRDLSDPFLLPEMKVAVDRVLQAVDGGCLLYTSPSPRDS